MFAPTVMRLHMNLHTVRRGRRTLHDILCNRLYSPVLSIKRANELRGTAMPRLRRVAHMCSSTLSVNCEKAEKDTLR